MAECFSDDENQKPNELFRKFDKVPAVIDREMIMDSVINSAPSTVCQKLFKRKKFEYEYVFKLYLDFKDILKIDHLWMMENLKILSLAHNSIEVIENMENLVNLVQLDLSFNRIERIEGLEGLKNIEVLCLYNNNIKTIEKLNDQDKLSIFSIGNNQIEGRDCILYLRRFKKLLSINLANNPCTKTKYFKESLAAYVPSLLYYEYKLLTQEDRDIGLEYNAEALELLDMEEMKRLKEEEQSRQRQEKADFYSNAFIEGLATNQLYVQMFHNDYEGRAFEEMGEQTKETYERLRLSVNEICLDICKAGEENYNRRKKEVEIFKKSWEDNQKTAEQKAFHQQVLLLRKWKHLVLEVGKYLKVNVQELRSSDEEKFKERLREFRSIMVKAKEEFESEWYQLMEVEMKTYDKNESVINLYESGLLDIINIFIEKAQTYFTLLRDSETDFIEDMQVKLNRYMVEVYQRGNIMNVPPLLRKIVCDKDSLSNAIIACHDRHTLAIDTKEDYIVSKLKEWHVKETGHLLRLEILRNRKAVLKIRDSVDKAYRLYEKKALVMLNYFKTPEPLFVKTKKRERKKKESYESVSSKFIEEEESSTTEKSDESSDDEEEYLKKMTKETEFNEEVDWTKLLETIMEETEGLRPTYHENIRASEDAGLKVMFEDEDADEEEYVNLEQSKVHFTGVKNRDEGEQSEI